MQDLNDLFYFAQAVDHGGFAPAGRALGLPKSKLSRRVAALEGRLGVRLINRSTRTFAVTAPGRVYYDHCKAVLIEAEAAQEAVDSLRAAPRGVIRMTCPTTILHANVGAMLADFMTLYPEVTVVLEGTNRRVDPLSEGIDLAIRVRPPPLEDSDLVMRVFSDRGQSLVASPSLLSVHGRPATPCALGGWPSLGVGAPQQSHVWTLFGPDGAEETVPHRPRFVTTDMIALRDAAIAGVGVVQLPLLIVRGQLEDGSLVKVLPDWTPRREIVHAVFPTRRGMLPSVRALLNHLAARFAALDED
ncbi:MAG TPA: LysR family transcriptional regulator [Rhodospirillaceae bacterium]|nr:LysR family transcriptional regulator [Rhodospirillaceae bacterium]